jgi:hypothetical protein
MNPEAPSPPICGRRQEREDAGNAGGVSAENAERRQRREYRIADNEAPERRYHL